MYGGDVRPPDRAVTRSSPFTSFEQWDDLPAALPIVRTVPTEAERRGDFSQSVLNGRVAPSTTRSASHRWIGDAASSSASRSRAIVIPADACSIRPALKMLNEIPLPNQPGNIDNWQGRVIRASRDYWNLSQRVDVNFTDNWKMFVRYGQFKANLYQQNPTGLPASSRCRAATATA